MSETLPQAIAAEIFKMMDVRMELVGRIAQLREMAKTRAKLLELTALANEFPPALDLEASTLMADHLGIRITMAVDALASGDAVIMIRTLATLRGD